jgi:hypothetical protein
MRLVPQILLILAFLLAGPCGCAKDRKFWPFKKTAKATRARGADPQRVGTITLVNEEQGFALVDFGTRDVPEAGTALKVFGDGAETAILAVGEVRRRPFVAADIVKGMPRKGDVVFK